jgi:hypothetical protein
MFLSKVVEKTKKTYFVINNFFFFFENRPVYEMMWYYTAEPGRLQMKKWRMRIACWVPNATNTRSEYVILIALPPQQW